MEATSHSVKGYFEVTFVNRKKSLYRQAYSFVSGLTQQQLLSYHFETDIERMMEVRDVIEASSECQYFLFEDNPLHNDYYLDRITVNESRLYNL